MPVVSWFASSQLSRAELLMTISVAAVGGAGKKRISPPHATHYHLGDFWKCPDFSFTTRAIRELSILPKDDHYSAGRELLIERLANVGIEQFIVPDDFGPIVAEVLANASRRVGFCLSHSDLLRNGWKMIGVPTAVLFPTEGVDQSTKDRIWSVIRRQCSVLKHKPTLMLYVTPRDLNLDDRPAVQVLCAGGFCEEQELDRWRIDA